VLPEANNLWKEYEQPLNWNLKIWSFFRDFILFQEEYTRFLSSSPWTFFQSYFSDQSLWIRISITKVRLELQNHFPSRVALKEPVSVKLKHNCSRLFVSWWCGSWFPLAISFLFLRIWPISVIDLYKYRTTGVLLYSEVKTKSDVRTMIKSLFIFIAWGMRILPCLSHWDVQ